MAVVPASCMGLGHCGAKLCKLTGVGYPAEGRGGLAEGGWWLRGSPGPTVAVPWGVMVPTLLLHGGTG